MSNLPRLIIGPPPSQRPMRHDPAARARDFAQRYAEPFAPDMELPIRHDARELARGTRDRHAVFGSYPHLLGTGEWVAYPIDPGPQLGRGRPGETTSPGMLVAIRGMFEGIHP